MIIRIVSVIVNSINNDTNDNDDNDGLPEVEAAKKETLHAVDPPDLSSLA